MSQWQDTPYISALALAGALSLVALVAALRWAREPGAPALALVAVCTALWSFGYALELLAADLEAALGWARLQYLGIVVLPGSWLVFCARYSQEDRWLTRRRLLLLGALPAATLLAVWTNERHSLFWSATAIVPQGGLLLLDVTHGPLFWLHTGYSYLCLLVGTLFLARALVRSPFIYRGRLGALLIALAAPWAGNALYLLRLSPFGSLDLTPIAFTISNLAISWSIVRLRLFNLIPIARSAVLDQMGEAVVVLDDRGQVVDLNLAALTALSLERDRAVGSDAAVLFARWPQLVERYRQTIRVEDELELSDAGGTRWYAVRITPLFDSGNALRGRLLVWRDTTEERRALTSLLEAKEAAEAASRAKSAFLSNMSHELRTPLSAILGYAQLMELELQRGSYGQLPRYLGSLEDAGDHLLRLINNLLQISRIEAERVELELVDLELDELVAEVLTLARPLAARKGNELAVEGAAGLGLMRGDRGQLRQILLNLLENAAKFTEGGRITLAARREPGPAGDWIVFVVSDTGVGITAEELPTLFDVFTTPDPEKRLRFGGAGVGLAISRYFCRLMGGEIIPGQPSPEGSSFTVRLPAAGPQGRREARGEGR